MLPPSTITAAAEKDAQFLASDQVQAILRAVEARLAQQPEFAALEKRLDQLVPGWKTSEFWITTLGQIGAIIAACTGALPAKYAALAVTASQVAYAISRGLAKRGN